MPGLFKSSTTNFLVLGLPHSRISIVAIAVENGKVEFR